jgi:hypothetical protein
MRDQFRGYFQLSDEDLTGLWANAVFVLDANVLLNLYRLSAKASNEVLRVLEQTQGRIWLPHQAAWEYHRQRAAEIKKQADVYKHLITKLEAANQTILESLKPSHPVLKDSGLTEKVKDLFSGLKKDVEQLRAQHPTLADSDPYRDTLVKLFGDRVGAPYAADRLRDIFIEGQERYDNHIPPGYKDADKRDRWRFGDLVMWFQIMDYAKSVRKPIIFLTDDAKEDWWDRESGQLHPELVDEMWRMAGVTVYGYRSSDFVTEAQARLAVNVQDVEEIAEEIREVSEEREAEEAAVRESRPAFPQPRSYSDYGSSTGLTGLSEHISGLGQVSFADIDAVSRWRTAFAEDQERNRRQLDEAYSQFARLSAVPIPSYADDLRELRARLGAELGLTDATRRAIASIGDVENLTRVANETANLLGIPSPRPKRRSRESNADQKPSEK